jgi:hypothetical protein
MLLGDTTRRGTGILLMGDYIDLQQLYRTVHRFADYYDKTGTQPQNNVLLNFAYEVRKAFSGAREKMPMTHEGSDGYYFAFRYTWPQMLVVSNLLRQAAAWHPTNSMDQAQLYMLEACIKVSLGRYDADGAAKLKPFVGQDLYIHGPLLELLVQSIYLRYVGAPATKARFRTLPQLLLSYFDQGGQAYRGVEAESAAAAALQKCEPADLAIPDSAFPAKVTW